jgi:hypothetical protein
MLPNAIKSKMKIPNSIRNLLFLPEKLCYEKLKLPTSLLVDRLFFYSVPTFSIDIYESIATIF